MESFEIEIELESKSTEESSSDKVLRKQLATLVRMNSMEHRPDYNRITSLDEFIALEKAVMQETDALITKIDDLVKEEENRIDVEDRPGSNIGASKVVGEEESSSSDITEDMKMLDQLFAEALATHDDPDSPEEVESDLKVSSPGFRRASSKFKLGILKKLKSCVSIDDS